MNDDDYDKTDGEPGKPAPTDVHAFDQTNGMAEGLAGDADAPEQADKQTADEGSTGFFAVPAPGSQMGAGAVPVVATDATGAESDTDEGSSADTDDPTPA
ncbi:hypothetical protein ACFOYW_16335 [Gryllotalpicola reticulitermitis]|uniref:Preprotein translocase YidC n=1 Tax=Gryllotalpicola reticulitermitis TaxID=1184153 RepID=A0ABV8QD86_9MICO